MDGTAVIVFGVIVYGIVFGTLSSTVASKKGHSSGAWFWCGFVFGIFGLIAAAGLPTKSADSDRGSASTKTCPRCAESVKAAAAVCRYCGHEFEMSETARNLAESVPKPEVRELVYAKAKAIYREGATPVQLEAINRSLRELVNLSTIPSLQEIVLGSGNKAEEVTAKRVALKLICGLRDPSTISFLIDILDDEKLSHIAREGLESIGDQALPALRDVAINGSWWSVRRIAKNSIKVIEKGKNGPKG